MPYPVDALLARAGRSGTPAYRSDAIRALHLLDEILKNGGEGYCGRQPLAQGRLGVTVLTLEVIAETRQISTGEARPELLAELGEAFANRAASINDDYLHDWCVVMAAYCRRAIARLEGTTFESDGLQDAAEAISRTSEVPLVACDPDLASWIRANKGERQE